jgi:hypothetical protein
MFGEDVAVSLGAWEKAPALPAITVVLGVAFDIPRLVGPGAALISLPAGLLLVGWVGTQRIWYLRLFRGKQLVRHEIWPFTWAFPEPVGARPGGARHRRAAFRVRG